MTSEEVRVLAGLLPWEFHAEEVQKIHVNLGLRTKVGPTWDEWTGTGRTTATAVDAVACASERVTGRTIYLVAGTMVSARYLLDRAREIADKVGVPSERFTLLSLHQARRIRGIDPRYIFWDHTAMG